MRALLNTIPVGESTWRRAEIELLLKQNGSEYHRPGISRSHIIKLTLSLGVWQSNSPAEHQGSRMLGMWSAVHSFVLNIPGWISRGNIRRPKAELKPQKRANSSRTALIALIVSATDRQVLSQVAADEALDVHFAESYENAALLLRGLNAAVVLVDRNWPGSEWRTMLQTLASSPGRPSVILLSGVIDDYLWQEVVRCGGYDLLAKPVRALDVVRVIRLAMSYRKVAVRSSAPAPCQKESDDNLRR